MDKGLDTVDGSEEENKGSESERLDRVEADIKELKDDIRSLIEIFQGAKGALAFIKALAWLATTVVGLVYMISNTGKTSFSQFFHGSN